MIKVLVHGASGRMGHAVLEACSSKRLITKVLPVSRNPESEQLMTLDQVNEPVDVVIDFSLPPGLGSVIDWCMEQDVPLVSGTTGLDDEQQEKLKRASQDIGVIWSPNMSIAVHWLMNLAAETASRFGLDADVEIWEKHHRYKQDAPSGTALGIGEHIARARGQDFKEVANISRQGQAGPRQRGEIGIASIRAGRTTGEHKILFSLEGEELEFSHQCLSRQAYARGAVEAALWLATKPAGWYELKDVFASFPFSR